jgi:hypothetical protein
MRKIAIAAMLAAIAATASAQIDIGSFPVGTWVDANYGAYWEISSNNIRILAADGTVFFDFSKATIQGFKVEAGAAGVSISWTCPETGKFYKLTKTLTNMNIVLEIDRPDQPHYSVEMQPK